MIVKNEAANIERCLRSVAPYIDSWVIVDTGSADDTKALITKFFRESEIPGEIFDSAFVNFEHTRNMALKLAKSSYPDADYLLLLDADMELVVEDQSFRERLSAPGYQVIQRAQSLTYWNTRLVKHGARYRGVTHEYIELEGTEKLEGIWFKDHADGSNRPNKFERDIVLLTDALKKEPDNARYWYYLAQSYRDSGRTADAVEAYARRAAMGGWEEEAWSAKLNQARCRKALHDHSGFVSAALHAYGMRPNRAEPLYDLAYHYRNTGRSAPAAMFAETGMNIPWPEDILFVEDFPYQFGCREEMSISGHYCAPLRGKGRDACDGLALDRHAPERVRDQARWNLFYYIRPLKDIAPSFQPLLSEFKPAEGWNALNPSVVNLTGTLFVLQRTVNYIRTDKADYEMPPDDPVIRTRNFLGTDHASPPEILPPCDLPDPLYGQVIGFEDARLFWWREAFWCSSTVRELNVVGHCEQVLARIGLDDTLSDWRVIGPEGPKRTEKNWMPLVDGDNLRFVYLCDPTRVIDERGVTVAETIPTIAADQFRGGSQAIPFDDGWLMIVHVVHHRPHDRVYHHRFVWLDADYVLRKTSHEFYLHHHGIEFVAGMAWHPDGPKLAISYGVKDRESWLATIDEDEVRGMLRDTPPRPEAVRNFSPLWSAAPDETNCVLQTSAKVDLAARAMSDAQLPLHPDWPKNWDTAIALYHAIATTLDDPNSPILDAGAASESAFLPGLARTGYTDLTGINLLFEQPETRGGVLYDHGDITRTKYKDEAFAFIACLSVIEHNVDVDKFLAESARLLKPGGHLFISFDYWRDPIDYSAWAKRGVHLHFFTPDEVREMVKTAADHKLIVTSEPSYDCQDRVVEHISLHYTFMNLLFRKA